MEEHNKRDYILGKEYLNKIRVEKFCFFSGKLAKIHVCIRYPRRCKQKDGLLHFGLVQFFANSGWYQQSILVGKKYANKDGNSFWYYPNGLLGSAGKGEVASLSS